MTKMNYNKIKGHFPLTIQNAKFINQIKQQPIDIIKATNYQSNNVNQQQYYKPISKILQF